MGVRCRQMCESDSTKKPEPLRFRRGLLAAGGRRCFGFGFGGRFFRAVCLRFFGGAVPVGEVFAAVFVIGHVKTGSFKNNADRVDNTVNVSAALRAGG